MVAKPLGMTFIAPMRLTRNPLPAVVVALCSVVGHARPDTPCGAAFSPRDSVTAGAEGAFFYHVADRGSDRLINPFRLILNGGFGIMQMDNVENRVLDVPYRVGFANVWRNITDPIPAIEHVGWRTFLFQEILPFNLEKKKAQYWPNYMNHLIGGGMSFRMMTEWYSAHEFPVPPAWSVGTILLYHMLNEAVENGRYEGPNTDAIADMLVFDPLSMVLFSFDPVCRFFSHTLHMNDWSYQISYDPWHKTLENNGQNFVAKWRIPRLGRWGLFYHWGTHGEFGVCRTDDRGACWSWGVGFKANDVVHLTPEQKTVDLVMVAGVFYDRNNSLLASLLYAKTKDYAIRLNLYPGLVRLFGIDPGVFVGIGREGRVSAGLTIGALPWLPVGIAASG